MSKSLVRGVALIFIHTGRMDLVGTLLLKIGCRRSELAASGQQITAFCRTPLYAYPARN
jgi:hypothetical protein